MLPQYKDFTPSPQKCNFLDKKGICAEKAPTAAPLQEIAV